MSFYFKKEMFPFGLEKGQYALLVPLLKFEPRKQWVGLNSEMAAVITWHINSHIDSFHSVSGHDYCH